MKAHVATGLALLWRPLSFIWVSLTIGIFNGVLASWLFSTGTEPITGSGPLRWVLAHILLTTIVLLGLLVLTICSYFAHVERELAIQKQATTTVPYNERVRQLTRSLNDASANVDSILREMAQIVQEREKAVTILEEKQTQIQRYIESLEKGPAESLKIFQDILADQARQQDKASRKLALKYFIYGSLVTLLGTAIGIAFTLPGLLGK